MIQIRRSEDRGHADHGWLRSHHTFSFADYYDPQFRRFGVLRVINEDFVAAGQGFGTHPHQDMEIVSYIVRGALEHKDSMGNSAVIRPGEVQRMSAGTGVLHSEFNPSADEPTHLLQIWIFPDRKGLEPGYEQKDYSARIAQGELVLAASNDGREGSVRIHQDAKIYIAKLPRGRAQTLPVEATRRGWLQLIEGEVKLGEHTLRAGDAGAMTETSRPELVATQDCHFLLFDLPGGD